MFRDALEVRSLVQPNDRVLDVGGAEEVFPRADVVLDIVPYESRRPGALSEEPERFSATTWIQADICSPSAWSRFADKEFDFVLCSHTLEDVRDPIGVCAQMIRIGRRGYIEVPSRLRECTRVRPERPIAGWDHHRWLVDLEQDTLVFTAKMQWAHDFDYAGERLDRCLTDYFLQFLGIEWEGSFGFVERMQKGSALETENLFHLFETFPFRQPAEPVRRVVRPPASAPEGPTFQEHRQFRLPIEEVLDHQEIVRRYSARCAARSG